MSDSPPVSPAAPPRRKRRWPRRVLWGLLLTLVLLWLVKVPLVNLGLRRLPGDWEITVTGVRPGFAGAWLAGVRVIHRPTGRQLAYAEKVEVANGWTGLLKGELGKLTLTKAEVSWREEFETPYKVPPPGGPPASPVIAWDAGSVNDGVFRWYELGREVPRLALRITRFEGGRLVIYNDGRLEAAEQDIALSEVVSREFVNDDTLEIESRSPLVEGVMTAQRAENRYTVEKVNLSAPECKVLWHRKDKPAPAPAKESGPPRPDWDKPVQFVIKDGTADPGRLVFTLHPPASAPVEFTAALQSLHTTNMRIAGGLPFIVGKTDAKLAEIKSPGTTLEARDLTFTATLDEQARFQVSAAEVNGAKVTDSNRLLAALGFTPAETRSLPLCSTGLDAKCVNLAISSAGEVTSPDAQNIVLDNFSAIMPGEKVPIAQATRVELSARPEEAIKDKRLRSVNVQKPEVKVTESQFTDELIPFSPAPPSPATQAAPPDKPNWYGWHTDSLTVRDGKVHGSDLGTGIPDASGNFSVETAPREPGGDPFYRIRVDNITFDNPLLAALPLRTGGYMDLDIHPLHVWETESIDQVKVNGAKVELNEAFLKLFQEKEARKPATGDAPPKPPENPGASTQSRPWKINRLVLENCEVAIDDVGDGRRLVIPIREQVFENVPLGSGVLDHDAAHIIQKVEVPGIFLYAPFNENQTVVELPVNFIYFSFAGLLEKRLERVELVTPKIKAGQPLFDFIDRAKQRFSTAAVTTPRPLLAAADKDSLPMQQALEAVRNGTAEKPAVWEIPFFTESGVVITAPLGLEWTQIPRLPFRNARVREGPDKGKPIPFRLRGEEVHGELAIESGWYDFPDYKIRLWMSDSGRVVFNFPLKDKDNNLVEVFENNTLIYRHLTITKVWLSVTYDKEGIYVSFGGETCGGYITGKINLYLDQLYSWDASASFTGINVKPLTGKLTREYVLMNGKVDVLNVTAYGDMHGLYQTTASLKMSGAGRLQIKALDNLRRKFTDARVDWTDDLGRIGVDTLRDFSFTSCEGSAQLFGQEGKVKLLFKGRDGSRDFTVNLHDYRHRPEKSIIRF